MYTNMYVAQVAYLAIIEVLIVALQFHLIK